jgi:hypothetical protein
MPIRYNVDTDADYIMLQHQGVLIPTPTRIAVDDGETISGGVQPGGGSTSAAGGSAVAGTAAQQNFSQIQENPLPCVAHDTPIAVLDAGSDVVWVLVQDLLPGAELWYAGDSHRVTQIDRVWSDSLWYFGAAGYGIVCSDDHRVIAGFEDYDGTSVSSMACGDSVLVLSEGRIVQEAVATSHAVEEKGWVYRITLETTDDLTCHWFVSGKIVSHNVKIQDDQR